MSKTNSFFAKKQKPRIIAMMLIFCFSASSCEHTANNIQASATAAATEIISETPTLQPTATEAISETPTPQPTIATVPAEVDYQSIQPYEIGQIMIIMYHAVVEGKPPSMWQRNIDDFKNDLQTLYDKGYRLMSMNDLINNNITVAAGYTPVILTFDDGLKETFSLTEKDGTLVVNENTAIGLLEQFTKEHPDFGRGTTLFINSTPFPGDGTVKERLQWLVDNGYDIGNHTYSHADLKTADAAQIQEEIGRIDLLIKENLPGYMPVGFSYPYGKRPEPSLYPYILQGDFEGNPYNYRFALKEGFNGLPSAPNRVGFDPLNLPRVVGSSGQEGDLGWFLNYYEENPIYKYVSDGRPDVICLPEKYKENVDLSNLGDKTLDLYE